MFSTLLNSSLALLLLTSGVFAQGINNNPDLSNYATKADVPAPLGSIPPQPTGSGVVGTPGVYMPGSAAPRLTVQRTTVATDSSGNWSVTWNTAFQSSTPTVNVIPINPSGTTPYNCNVLTRSATAATGKCWQLQSQTVALISLTISLAPANTPISTSVMVIGAEPTQ